MWIFYLPFFVARMIATIELWHFTCRCPTGPSGGSPRSTPCAAPCSGCRSPRAWCCRWRRRCNVRALSARGGGVVGVAVLVGQRVAARNRARVGALHLGERLAHQSEAHVHGVAYALGLATGLHQSVKLVVGVGVAERTAQRFLLLSLAGIGAARAVRTAKPSGPFRLLRCLWCNNVGQPQNIVHGVVFILRLHDAVPVGREQHALQPLALAVVGVRAFRAVAHARVYGVPVLVVAHLRHDRLFLALLGRLDARYLTRGVVAVGYHLPVGIGHGAHAVVAVVIPLRDIGGDGLVRYEQRTHGLQDFTHLRNSSSGELFFPNIITTYISNSIYFKLITIN